MIFKEQEQGLLTSFESMKMMIQFLKMSGSLSIITGKQIMSFLTIVPELRISYFFIRFFDFVLSPA